MNLEDDYPFPIGHFWHDAGCGFVCAAARVESPFPNAFRMARYPDGKILLQGAYAWSQGNEGGIFWKPLPVVDVDMEGHVLND